MTPRNETEFVDQIVELAILHRYAVCHFRPARTHGGWRTAIQGHAGFPDLVIAKNGRVLFRECKFGKGQLSSEQLDWARQLSGNPHWAETPDAPVEYRTGLLYDVWRVGDFASLIVPTLTARRAA